VGFERAADVYERGRPDYPIAAISHLVRVLSISAGTRVLELGAGTGKFTRSLLPTGAEIIAIEPVEAMRSKLAGVIPSAQVFDGTAEAIPVPDFSVDAVVAAQAFHWFHGELTLREIHRVLKPCGGLGLVWNLRDESADWVRKLTAIIEPHEVSVPYYSSMEWKRPFDSGKLFSPLEHVRFRHSHAGTPESIVDRVASISFISALPDGARCAVLDQVRDLLRTDPTTRGQPQIEFPYHTDVYWCRRS